MKRLFIPFLLFPITTLLCGCPTIEEHYFCGICGQEYDPEETHYCNKGALNVNPTSFRNGDKVMLTYKDKSSVNVNGEVVSGTAVYCIDGNEVVRSTDAANDYAITYIPEGLTKGEHLLSAKVVHSASSSIGSVSVDVNSDAIVKIFVIE